MKQAFTLIEIAIASLIFTVVITTATVSFISATKVSAKSRASTELTSQARFATETIIREIRSAHRYTISPGGQTITLYRYDDSSGTRQEKQVVFSKDSSGNLIATRNGATSSLINAGSIKVVSLEFSPYSQTGTEDSARDSAVLNYQPYVGVRMRLDSTDPQSQNKSPLIVKTSVTMRNYEKVY